MGRYAAGNAPEIDRLVEDAIAKIASEIAALHIPRLAGVVLGGGYGRGEGGVYESEIVELCNCGNSHLHCEISDGDAKFHNENSTIPQFHNSTIQNLSNDLDFYVVTEEGASEADIEKIGEMLAPIAEKWTAKLGVDVDFCRAKTPWRLKHDEERLMIQELVNGYVDVCGKKGAELFAHVRRLEPSELPWSEAVRLLMNRGVGLLLAAEAAVSPETANCKLQTANSFIVRNINKCVLGAGDARLIATGRYAWKVEDRAKALGDALYSKAVEWKLRPKAEPVCDWETAREAWLAAYREISALQRPRRAIYHAARWLVRRRSIGDLRTIGFDPVVRIARSLKTAIEGRRPFPPSLKKDWYVFN